MFRVLLIGCVWFVFSFFSTFSLFSQSDFHVGMEGVSDSVLIQDAMADSVVRENDTIPHGIWEVAQIAVEKNTDGRFEQQSYNRNVRVQSYVQCPQIWGFRESNTLLLRYSDGTEETAHYSFEGNQLHVDIAVAMLSYQFSINEETLTLGITHCYHNNLPRGTSERIEEKWTIILKKLP